MKIKTGYLYHIKEDYFKIVNDKKMMINHENGHSRPTYFTIQDENILWFIPISSKVDKYKMIIEDEQITIQNAFPTLEKYIAHPHMMNGKPLKVIESLKNEILDNFKYMMSMKEEGINLFFTDIDKIKEIILEETLIKN